MKISIRRAAVAAVSIAMAASPIVPAAANAGSDHTTFASPSGNIRCVVSATAGRSVQDDTGEPAAYCQLEDITFEVPPTESHDDSGQPCPSRTGSGNDFALVAGAPGYVRCSYAALNAGFGPWPVLEYGQSTSAGSITCTSERRGMTCTDTATGHFFRASRESYDVG
jgi:hypothetical protein